MSSVILVDSGCDLNEQLIADKGVEVKSIPLTLQVDDKSFVDDETLDLKHFKLCMKASKNCTRTAAPSPLSFMEKFEGSDNVYIVTLSSKLSSTYNSAMMAKNMYLEDVGHKLIHVFDSLSASVGELLVANKIAEQVKKGLAHNDIVNAVEHYIKEQKTYFVLEKMDNLVKNGRVNSYIARISGLLGIRLVCSAEGGDIKMLDKAIGRSKAINKMLDIIERDCVGLEKKIAAISHVDCLEKALEIKEKMMNRFKFRDIVIAEAGGLVSTYADESGIIIAF